MNRRRFLVALAALPIAAKFGGMVPAMPTNVQIAQYSDFLNLSDYCLPIDEYAQLYGVLRGEVGRLASVSIENESDVLTHLA